MSSLRTVETPTPSETVAREGSHEVEEPVMCLANGAPDSPGTKTFGMSGVLASLSYALDLTEGQPRGHTVRACLIGMEIGKEVGLSAEQLSDLYYALLLKDAGCSANAAPVANLFSSDDQTVKRNFKTTDWTRLASKARYVFQNARVGASLTRRLIALARIVKGGDEVAREFTRIRCERGADIARGLGFPGSTAAAVRSLDEHWDGSGHPDGLRETEIPLLARICCFAQTLEVFLQDGGRDEALRIAKERRGTWFDPHLVDLVLGWGGRGGWWDDVRGAVDPDTISENEPSERVRVASAEELNLIAEAFAGIIDAKSPYTFSHSSRVARIARCLGSRLGVPRLERHVLYQTGLLHDVGKLAISNRILDKAGPLTEDQFAQVRKHPHHTWEILRRAPAFSHLAWTAAVHHERLDGCGYPWGISGTELDLNSRIVAVADVFEAITADRPYRAPMPEEQVLEILRREAGPTLDPDVTAALIQAVHEGDPDTAPIHPAKVKVT